jgi:Protein of unknown function (DUF2721)
MPAIDWAGSIPQGLRIRSEKVCLVLCRFGQAIWVCKRGDERMDYTLTADPFSILTIVVAPAVLTNASSVLALGTNNRLARVADRSHAVIEHLAKLEPDARHYKATEAQLPALQTRAQLLLQALRFFYLGLGLFATSALISIAGSIAGYYGGQSAFQIAAGIGVVCGASAVIALVCGCVHMIRETQLAVRGLASDAASQLD